jgi:hypothetical protein
LVVVVGGVAVAAVDDDDGEWNFRRTAPTPNDVRRTSMPKMPSDRAAGWARILFDLRRETVGNPSIR